MDTTSSVHPADDVATISVHETRRRRPFEEARRLVSLLDRQPELADDQTAAVRLLESEVSRLLDKAGALFMPTGKMAQQIALRIHADRRPGRRTFVGHRASHPVQWEQQNYAVLHGLDFRPAGDLHRLVSGDDLKSTMDDTVAAVMWELPQRDIGGQLPPWEDLRSQIAPVHAAGAAAHMDGARIWQAGPFYGRSYAEIAAPFDSVYVSLYKDLEAPSGALLLGDESFIARARVWRQRLGGTIDDAWPLALLALDGLRSNLPRMASYLDHARAIAIAIASSTQATITPSVPQVPLFHVHLPISAQAAERAHQHVIEERGIRLALRFRSNPDPGRCSFEMTVGAETLEQDPADVAEAVRFLIERGLASD